MNVVEYRISGKLSKQLRLLICLILITLMTPPYNPRHVYATPAKPIPRATFFAATETTPKNIILIIGDGMGPEQIIASGMYSNGVHNSLAFESAPYQAQMQTYSANSLITDSAASATAMATGQKVNNGVVSTHIPGNGEHIETSLEYFRDRCKSTGMVVTSVVNHATPAAFASHANSRSEYLSLLKNYFQSVKPNLIMGGGPSNNADTYATDAGYTIVSDRTELEALTSSLDTRVFGRFGTGDMPYEYDYTYGLNNFFDEQPHLSEMTSKSIELLQEDPDGFFLLIEGSRIDHAAHANMLPRVIYETLEFEKTVQTVLDWAEGRNDTLVIVTADHETGGLRVTQNRGAGEFPSVTWSTGGHTGVNVGVYAWGPNAEMATGIIDNTAIYDITTANSTDNVNCAAQTTTQPEPAPIETAEVTLRWQANSQNSIAGFHIMRSTDMIFDHALVVTPDLIPTANSDSYEFTDRGINASVDYTYWLVIVDVDGTTTLSDQIAVPRSIFTSYLPLLAQ